MLKFKWCSCFEGKRKNLFEKTENRKGFREILKDGNRTTYQSVVPGSLQCNVKNDAIEDEDNSLHYNNIHVPT